MAARLKLFIDFYNKKLIKGLRNEGTFTLPTFYQGDVVPMQVYILEPLEDSGPNSYAKMDIDDMSLKLAVSATPTGTPAGPTPYVTQFNWTKNTIPGDHYFYADVPFNTAELNTVLGADQTATGYLEMEITEGSAIHTVYQGTCTINAEVIETGTLTVAAGETPLSLEVANQRFASKMMGAGEGLTLVSKDGLRRVIMYCDNDGSFQSDSM